MPVDTPELPGPDPDPGPQTPPGGGNPDTYDQVLQLIDRFPQLKSQLMSMWRDGTPYPEILAWATNHVPDEPTTPTPTFSFPASEPFDPWENGIGNAYYQIWGGEIPEAEISYAKSHGLNVYEFIDYQRSKESFKRTEIYQRETTARAAALMDSFGFGGGFSGSAYPVTGAGTI
jgi:hypothetical protein